MFISTQTKHSELYSSQLFQLTVYLFYEPVSKLLFPFNLWYLRAYCFYLIKWTYKTSFYFRDHEFDKDRKKKASRRIRFGTVSGPSAPSRGALPVRQFHRKDESKILGTKRLQMKPHQDIDSTIDI